MNPNIHFPKVRTVRAEGDKTLWVLFDNGVAKRYDCRPLLNIDSFRVLQNDAIFHAAHADPHGYGVVWSDNVDLAESEVWINGKELEDYEDLKDLRSAKSEEQNAPTQPLASLRKELSL